MESITYNIIGYMSCQRQNPYEAPRQSVLADDSIDVITLKEEFAGAALKDLATFDHLWLVYDFNKNKAWKPLVLPPRGGRVKRGVFATRSPYRPNSIGISCVKLIKIEKNKIYISQHDLLDKTPILDIKPYIEYADSFPKASRGWLEEVEPEYKIIIDEDLRDKLGWVSQFSHVNIFEVIKTNLSYEPLNNKKKRVKKVKDDTYELAIKTWRVLFLIKNKTIKILEIYSGYNESELNKEEDPYADKNVHKDFNIRFGNNTNSIKL